MAQSATASMGRTTRASCGRHPTAAELYADGAHEATGQFVIGSSSLNKERADTLDVSLRGEGPVHWHLSTYIDRFSDYIYLAPTPLFEDGLPVFEYRQADARFTGAELEVTLPLLESAQQDLQLRLAADYVRARLDDGGPLPQIPPLRFGGDLNYQAGAWQGELSAFRYAKQTRVADYETPTDGYTLVDVSVGYSWDPPTGPALLFAKGSTLTDADARRHTSLLKESAPLPGRSLGAGLRLEF